jgi:hypothetical protein
MLDGGTGGRYQGENIYSVTPTPEPTRVAAHAGASRSRIPAQKADGSQGLLGRRRPSPAGGGPSRGKSAFSGRRRIVVPGASCPGEDVSSPGVAATARPESSIRLNKRKEVAYEEGSPTRHCRVRGGFFPDRGVLGGTQPRQAPQRGQRLSFQRRLAFQRQRLPLQRRLAFERCFSLQWRLAVELLARQQRLAL